MHTYTNVNIGLRPPRVHSRDKPGLSHISPFFGYHVLYWTQTEEQTGEAWE